MRLIRFLIFLTLMACCSEHMDSRKPVQLITLDPGHFHAALVQKSMFDEVDSTVYVYASASSDLDLHLNRINGYNTRQENPTHWNEKIYTGTDFFEKMIAEKTGNVVLLSGNNQKKTEYIVKSLDAGLHVLADKPMAINESDYRMLLKAFAVSNDKSLLLYDIMTERFEINTILQRELSQVPEIFGELEKGTPENPSITKESVHHFYKYVSGSVLTRPAWFFDVNQQGEGLVDVMTHLVDLVQWECFPNQTLDTTNIQIGFAKRWSTNMTLNEFTTVTKQAAFPDYLIKNVINDSLQVFCNGEISYSLKGVHARATVTWKYQAPEGAGDTHYSILRGTKANLLIKQGAEENYKATLYIEPISKEKAYESTLLNSFKGIEQKYPGVQLEKSGKGWKVNIPSQYHVGHEAHFAQVTKNFLIYLKTKRMPEWEVSNMITKYYVTTKALAQAREN